MARGGRFCNFFMFSRVFRDFERFWEILRDFERFSAFLTLKNPQNLSKSLKISQNLSKSLKIPENPDGKGEGRSKKRGRGGRGRVMEILQNQPSRLQNKGTGQLSCKLDNCKTKGTGHVYLWLKPPLYTLSASCRLKGFCKKLAFRAFQISSDPFGFWNISKKRDF